MNNYYSINLAVLFFFHILILICSDKSVMPVAASSQNEPQVSYQYLPKPPGFVAAHEPQPTSSPSHFNSQDNTSFINAEFSSQYARNSPQRDSLVDAQYFNTHSPPILNLSPNLSPAELQRNSSPLYDLRDSTRRRSLQGRHAVLIIIL